MNKVFLGLGSNVGDKKQYITSAIKLVSKKIVDIKKASVYKSKPVGYTNQNDFLNTAITGKTLLPPEELLLFVKNIEYKIGRIQRFRWGPREIDIDILFYSNLIQKKENLEVPHPRLHERDFVLLPLIELDPNLVHPILKKTVIELLKNIPIEQRSILKM